MLFARGVWSIFGVRKSSLDNFRNSLLDAKTLITVSQVVAATRTKFTSTPSHGINPYAQPRMDEGLADQTKLAQLADQISTGKIVAPFWSEYYGSEETQFAFGDDQFGFWVVINDYEDVTDPKSKQEALAYKEANKPFKFLSKDEKKVIEANVVASAVLARTQFPVLVDFNSETVYVASGNAEQVGIVRELIAQLGGEDFSLAWQFETPEWTRKFLAAIAEKNKFETEMSARAEELMRFHPDEIEKLEDRMMESVVSNFFALSELETSQWAGLSTPARIHINSSYDPVSVSSPSTAFSVIHEFKKMEIAAAAVVFQSQDTKFNKKGEEKLYRTDIFTLDVNDNINLIDAGAAMLRGFDLPTFKKDMKRAAKNRGDSLAIGEYWREWLSSMKTASNMFADNVTETLKIDKKKYGLRPYESEVTVGEAQPANPE